MKEIYATVAIVENDTRKKTFLIKTDKILPIQDFTIIVDKNIPGDFKLTKVLEYEENGFRFYGFAIPVQYYQLLQTFQARVHFIAILNNGEEIKSNIIDIDSLIK